MCVCVCNGMPVCLLQQIKVMTVLTVGGAPRQTQLISALSVWSWMKSAVLKHWLKYTVTNGHSPSIADITHGNEYPGVIDLRLISSLGYNTDLIYYCVITYE